MAEIFCWAGAAGANNGTSEADAFTSFQDALNAIVNVEANNVYVRGNWVLSSNLTITSKYTSWHIPIKIIHVNDLWENDPTDIGSIDGNSAVAQCFALSTYAEVLQFENWDIKNATSQLFSGSSTLQAPVFKNCILQNAPRVFSAGSSAAVFINTTLINITTGIENGNSANTAFIFSKMIACGAGFNAVLSFQSIHSIAHNGSKFVTIQNASYTVNIINSVIDGMTTHGVNIASSNVYLTCCRLTHNAVALYGDGGGVYNRVYVGCGFFGNTTKLAGSTNARRDTVRDFGNNYDMSSNGYVDRGADNFNLLPDAEGVYTSVPVGLINGLEVNASHITAGINPEPLATAITVTDIVPAEGGIGSSVTITGTEFSASGNIVKLGGSGGTSCTVTAESTTEITATIPSYALGDVDIYIENADGTNIVVPNGFKVISTAIPVFAGITNFEILSSNKFYVKCGTATNSPDYLNVYISTTATPFAGTYSFKVPYSANKEILVGFASDHYNPLVGGTVYYCGLRAENSVGEDTNTAVLSNICSGSEMIQRMNIVTPVISL